MSITFSRNKIFFPNFNSELFASIKGIFEEHGYQLCDKPELIQRKEFTKISRISFFN
jgi:hypothetical protein